MKVRPYEKVSLIYDSLMENVNYSSWANYIFEVAQKHTRKLDTTLELAAGNCKISDQIYQRFKYYVAADISLQMLKSSDTKGIPRLCCDMISLPLKMNFDLVFSAFDSVNYLLKEKDIAALFQQVYEILDPEGIFTFDVSLESNSLNFIYPKTIEGRSNGFQYQRVSYYKKHSRIHHNSFYISDGISNNYREEHKQKIYKLETYFNLSEKCGFKVTACYNCFTFTDIKFNAERAQFILKKINR